MIVTVIGGGLAGSKTAYQLARRGVAVRLIDQKPEKRSPAHSCDHLSELVCSNSLRGGDLSGAVGLLKEELRRAGSLLIRCADATAVPAGRALAVDRDRFAAAVEKALRDHPLINVDCARVEALPQGPAIVATGPMTDGGLLEALESTGAVLNYHDTIAPLVIADSVDMGLAFLADRYEDPDEGAAYINCPMDEQQYLLFVRELVQADKTLLREFETAPFFEGCLPVEEMASRGPLTLAHGPLKPVGLRDPRTGTRPFAVVQLRPENDARTAYNLVGFQTRLTRLEQKRVFRMIPGLAGARFERFGQVHRNTFVDAPEILDSRMRVKGRQELTLAGQLTGVEGYVESIASGLLAGLNVASRIQGFEMPPPPVSTALGGVDRHTGRATGSYQPSNIVWSMIETPRRERKQKKREHRLVCADSALGEIERWLDEIPWLHLDS